ncbi:hypothetical protein [Chromatium okenii]|uniref:hypothetical protein n=1 Tax=Chromatium okenii TaxID=61644 RepID=UPI001F5BCC36|nr:hypothetical protein [Chromatium okenii]
MDWKKASIINAKRLEQALDVERFARQLAELPQARQAGITQAQLTALTEERNRQNGSVNV